MYRAPCRTCRVSFRLSEKPTAAGVAGPTASGVRLVKNFKQWEPSYERRPLFQYRCL